jgi:hypothetical protein
MHRLEPVEESLTGRRDLETPISNFAAFPTSTGAPGVLEMDRNPRKAYRLIVVLSRESEGRPDGRPPDGRPCWIRP